MHRDTRTSRRGQATVEYVLIVAVVLAALIAAISATGSGSFGQAIKDIFTKVADILRNAVTTLPGTAPGGPPPNRRLLGA